MTPIIRLISLFSASEKRKLLLVIGAIILTAGLEVVGVGALGPFMSVVANPGIIENQPVLNAVYTAGGFESRQSFIVALGAAMFLLILLGNAFKMVTFYAIYRFIAMRRYQLGLRLFRQYLYQPYTYFLDHNSTELSKNILSEVDLVMGGVLRPAMEGLARGVLVLGILFYLLVLNPLLALTAAGVLTLVYSGLYSIVRPRLLSYGEAVRVGNRVRYKATGEAFSAIKDVKILGIEPAFEQLYSSGVRKFVLSEAAREILTMLPKYTLEAITFGLVILLVIVMLSVGDSVEQVLPLLAVYGFAAYKLMPSLQHVFSAISQARYYSHTVDALYEDYQRVSDLSQTEALAREPNGSVTPQPFGRSFGLDQVTFYYESAPAPVLKNVSLEIQANTTVGFVGTTGCGKTTLVDVVMGLLRPDSGVLLVDGRPISGGVGPWQRNFGYVPQQIFLSDDSISANIAFGVPELLRDHEAVKRAADIANLHEFISSDLPAGYDTVVGERGIRLSGGQRQRLGIARALYHDPPILVMDEATSALDSVTEDAVMDAIHNLMHSKTIIIIAHRITTVQPCDAIYLMERGRIVAHGTYDELVQSSSRFQAMAKVR